MTDILRNIITRNRAGDTVAIPSVCSAQPDVLKASLARAETLDRHIVIEATSNQVNQDGGYTGITPDKFIAYVHQLADEASVDRARLLFGGDHLGPQAWRSESPEHAMSKARKLVADYVAAGFSKIHLDCSEGCAGEAAQLGDEQTSRRSAELARICVQENSDLLFVVGTEVPPPGGARTDESGDIPPTDPLAAKVTLQAHGNSFGDMAPLIGALVVQPGVEFTPMAVHHLPMNKTLPSAGAGMLSALTDWPGVCLEVHSTDYQHPPAFIRLAQLGYAFQKVGPALTFAYRQALYSLDQARGVMGGGKGLLQTAMEQLMVEQPGNWISHYHGDESQLYTQRHFGLADRIRYYWAQPAAQAAVGSLRKDMTQTIPDPVLWQTFSPEVLHRAENLAGSQVQRLIDAQIQLALDPYFFNASAGTAP